MVYTIILTCIIYPFQVSMKRHLTSECCISIQSDKTWLIKKYGSLSWDMKMLMTSDFFLFRITCLTYPHPRINQPVGDPHRFASKKHNKKTHGESSSHEIQAGIARQRSWIEKAGKSPMALKGCSGSRRRGKIAIPPKLTAIAPVKEAGVPQKERII